MGENIFLQRHIENRAFGISPTASGWDTDPTDLDHCTDGDWTNETGEGVTSRPGTSGDIGILAWDMGTAYNCIIVCRMNVHRVAGGDGTPYLYIEASTNGVNYYSSVVSSSLYTDAHRPVIAFIFGRYFRLRWSASSVTINPSIFHVKVSEIAALKVV